MSKVKFGVSKLHYATISETTATGGGTVEVYGNPVEIAGAVSISLDAQTQDNIFYADNEEYFAEIMRNGYEGSIEVAKLPDSFLVDCLGMKFDSAGLLVESKDDTTKYFALLWQFEEDGGEARRGVCYKCRATATPQIAGATTTDSKEPQTDTLNIKAIPNQDGFIKAKVESEKTTAYDSWFDTVQEPSTFVTA